VPKGDASSWDVNETLVLNQWWKFVYDSQGNVGPLDREKCFPPKEGIETIKKTLSNENRKTGTASHLGIKGARRVKERKV